MRAQLARLRRPSALCSIELVRGRAIILVAAAQARCNASTVAPSRLATADRFTPPLRHRGRVVRTR